MRVDCNMPTPAYIICAEKRTVDKETGQISFFNVIEKVKVAGIRPTTPGHFQIPFECAVISAWQMGVADRGREFENKVYFESPDGKPVFEFIFPPIKITSDAPSGVYRHQMLLRTLPPFPSPGVWRIFNVLRDTETDASVSQSVPIAIEGDAGTRLSGIGGMECGSRKPSEDRRAK